MKFARKISQNRFRRIQRKADDMKLSETIRVQIADKVTRVFTFILVLAMILFMLSVGLLGGHQYHRMIPAGIAIATIIPAWLFARKGKPLTGVWFLYACMGLAILSGMILSGGVRAPAYMAVLFCITPVVALHGLRGGIIFVLIALGTGVLFCRLEALDVLGPVKEPPTAFIMAFICIYLSIQIGLIWIPVHLMFKALTDSERQNLSLNQAINERQTAQEHLTKTKWLLEETQAISRLGGWEYDLTTQKLTWTDEVYRIHGMDPADGPVEVSWALGCYSPEHQHIIIQAFNRAVQSGESYDLELDLFRKDGAKISVRTMGRPTFSDGVVVRVTGNIMDITSRRQAEIELQESEERYRSLVENTTDGYFVCEIPSGKFIYLNQSICAMLGHTMQSAYTLLLWDIFDTGELKQMRKNIQHLLEGETPVFKNDIRNIIRKDGSHFSAEISTSLVSYKRKNVLQGGIKDITERERLLLQLQQAQRMEAIGQLAGGVAHDYNNMLSVIIGYAELSLLYTQPDEPVYENLMEISKAAERSKSVTRQLLAFARKEAIAPQVLDLNSTIENMLKMIRRLIGEDIDFQWHPKAGGIWPIHMDPSQIDQILANLSVNARDAITNGGRIVIETSTVTLDAHYCAEHEGLSPGDFVSLAVTDNGSGMEAKTLERIYEPFFTTKGMGKGTGLGMSTVYGIVKQNKGTVEIESTVGVGTAIRIYLPRYEGDTTEDDPIDDKEIPLGCGETVLVVEDEPSTLRLLEKFLSLLKYNCLSADTPAKALDMARRRAEEISLLMTDVIMPGMNGRELSERLAGQIPKIKCIYMSGYTADEIDDQGVLEEGVHFIQKPFSRKDIAVKIRAVLDQN